MEEEKLKSLLKINSVAVYTATQGIYDVIMRYKDPSVFFTKTNEIILPDELLQDRIKKLVKDASEFDADKELEECKKLGVKIITCLDDEFPESFREISNPPLLIYLLGEITDRLSISIVGTRHPTAYGIRHATKIASDLAKAGIVIVSGLARGIDTVVHKAVVKSGGITYAVIGSGFKRIYPSENKELVKKIVENGGAVITEYPLNMAPFKFNFPRRNRLIAALSFATLVIEGDYNSGALITARYAVEQGKEVMALPGPVDVRQSNGPNKLIKDGAYPIRNAADIVELIPPSRLFGIDLSKFSQPKEVKEIELTKEAEMIYNTIKENGGALTVDEISQKLSLPIDKLFIYLFELESRGIVELNSGRYMLVKD